LHTINTLCLTNTIIMTGCYHRAYNQRSSKCKLWVGIPLMPKCTRLTLCDKVVSDRRQVSRFLRGAAVSSTTKKNTKKNRPPRYSCNREKLKIEWRYLIQYYFPLLPSLWISVQMHILSSFMDRFKTNLAFAHFCRLKYTEHIIYSKCTFILCMPRYCHGMLVVCHVGSDEHLRRICEWEQWRHRKWGHRKWCHPKWLYRKWRNGKCKGDNFPHLFSHRLFLRFIFGNTSGSTRKHLGVSHRTFHFARCCCSVVNIYGCCCSGVNVYGFYCCCSGVNVYGCCCCSGVNVYDCCCCYSGVTVYGCCCCCCCRCSGVNVYRCYCSGVNIYGCCRCLSVEFCWPCLLFISVLIGFWPRPL
jgi:hypothetical protein